MVEYALLISGRVQNVVTTSAPLAEVKARWPSFEVKLLESCSQQQLEAYEFWDKRP